MYDMFVEVLIDNRIRAQKFANVESFSDNENFIILNLKDGGIVYLNKQYVVSFIIRTN